MQEGVRALEGEPTRGSEDRIHHPAATWRADDRPVRRVWNRAQDWPQAQGAVRPAGRRWPRGTIASTEASAAQDPAGDGGAAVGRTACASELGPQEAEG